MQDRFKFRAYNFLSKKYTYFDEPEVQFAERDSDYLPGIVMPLLDEKQSLYFGKYELQQCTGLKDKNGKLIYEGDIVKDSYTNTIYQIRLKNFAYCLENKKYIGYFHEMSHTFSSSRLKIVGNIYQNEELLNELYETSKLIGDAEC